MDAALEHHFDASPDNPLVQKIRPGWLYIDQQAFARASVTTDQLSRWLTALTKHDTAADLSTVPVGQRGDKVVQAAFPATVLDKVVGQS
jgi:hypothetical protein